MNQSILLGGRHDRGELISIIVGGLIPIVGVLFFGWSAHAAMFVFCFETILISAVFAWLFNYPERPTWKAILLALIMAPTGLMLLVLLKDSYRDYFMVTEYPEMNIRTKGYHDLRPDMGEMIRNLAKVTWTSLVVVAIHLVLFFRREMQEAKREGATYHRNNEVLLKWLSYVWGPFAVFALLMAGWKRLNPWSLAAILLLKLAIDVVFFLRDIKQERAKREAEDSN